MESVILSRLGSALYVMDTEHLTCRIDNQWLKIDY